MITASAVCFTDLADNDDATVTIIKLRSSQQNVSITEQCDTLPTVTYRQCANQSLIRRFCFEKFNDFGNLNCNKSISRVTVPSVL